MDVEILIVDDQPDNLRLLSSLLTLNGYRVRHSVSGERTFKTLERRIPNLILLDIKLPDISGYEVCRRLKAHSDTESVPIIFMSALHEVFDKVKAFKVGGVDYIPKPIQEEEVLVRVETQLQLSQYRHQLQQQNEQLQQQNEQLSWEIRDRERAQKELKLLLNSVSHDLQSPLSGLSLFLGSHLRSGEYCFNQREIQGMLSSCDRLSHLIEELVTAHSVGLDGMDLNKQWCYLPNLVEELLSSLSGRLAQEQVRIEKQFSQNLPKVFVDRERVLRVYDNLINNAIKYNPSPLTLTLSIFLTADQQQVQCEVIDDGFGIDPQVAENLFDPYTRGNNNQPGLGLGLYICRRVVESHHGKIGVETYLGEGTRFWFTFPIH